MTVYMYTSKPDPISIEPEQSKFIPCGGVSLLNDNFPESVSWTDQLWTKQAKPFLAPDWRNSLLLLLLIGGLSAFRMGRR